MLEKRKFKFMVRDKCLHHHNYKIRAYISTVDSVGNNHHVSVTATAPKPTVTYETRKVLICNIGDRTDLTVSWYVGDKIIQNEKNPHLVLTTQIFTHVLENKPFSCSVSNPVSNEKSDSLAVFGKSFIFHMLLILQCIDFVIIIYSIFNLYLFF